jgi:hypothetical protein
MLHFQNKPEDRPQPSTDSPVECGSDPVGTPQGNVRGPCHGPSYCRRSGARSPTGFPQDPWHRPRVFCGSHRSSQGTPGWHLRAQGFPAAVRFSNDTVPRRPDLNTTLGIAVKLIGVPGSKLLVENAPTCDFLLQNHDVFFVDTAFDMCEFTHAGAPPMESHALMAAAAGSATAAARVDDASLNPKAFRFKAKH